MIYDEPRLLTSGDKAILVEFGNVITPEINRKVRNLTAAIQKAQIPGITDLVPAYTTLLVCYAPLCISPVKLREDLYLLSRQPETNEASKPRVIEIPTVYGGKHGPDLGFIAKHNGLSQSEVVKIHTGNPYLIYMLGFIPGFPYLGGMSTKISCPRLESPRTKIPKGSVGIAGSQTGIYPLESPGGWRIIGRTPLKLFDPARLPPALLEAGNYLVFTSITPEEFNLIKDEVELGAYNLKETMMDDSNGNV